MLEDDTERNIINAQRALLDAMNKLGDARFALNHDMLASDDQDFAIRMSKHVARYDRMIEDVEKVCYYHLGTIGVEVAGDGPC